MKVPESSITSQWRADSPSYAQLMQAVHLARAKAAPPVFGEQVELTMTMPTLGTEAMKPKVAMPTPNELPHPDPSSFPMNAHA